VKPYWVYGSVLQQLQARDIDVIAPWVLGHGEPTPSAFDRLYELTRRPHYRTKEGGSGR
jgi:hypothetical protein